MARNGAIVLHDHHQLLRRLPSPGESRRDPRDEPAEHEQERRETRGRLVPLAALGEQARGLIGDERRVVPARCQIEGAVGVFTQTRCGRRAWDLVRAVPA